MSPKASRFDRGDVLWEIGDIESVWITADLFPEDMRSIAGARVATLTLPGGSEVTRDCRFIAASL